MFRQSLASVEIRLLGFFVDHLLAKDVETGRTICNESPMNKVKLATIAVSIVSATIAIPMYYGMGKDALACYSKSSTAAQVAHDCTALLEHGRLPSRIRANALFRRAFVSQDTNPQQAAVDYLAVLEIRPDWTWPLNNLGLIYLRQENPDKALPFFTRALEVEPDAHHRRRNRAEAYYKLGKYDQALADAEIILAAEPDNSFALWIRTHSLKKLGRS